jgi:predicted SAM-dependent methyltransferase
MHVYAQLWFEFKLLLVRVRTGGAWKRYVGAKGLAVNIGAGDQGRSGWINVDAFPAPGINCLFDCRKELPFPDDSVRMIFCEHFFEHLDLTDEVPFFLSECRRVLQAGGVLRVIVPDAGRYLKAYCAEGWLPLAELRTLEDDLFDPFLKTRYRTKMELINAVFRQGNQHKYAYDLETIQLVLTHCGFARVTQRTFGESGIPELALDQQVRSHESLYVEAVKA